MDKKSPLKPESPLKGKIFFLVFGVLIVGSIAVTFWRIVINRDYIISAEQECDPATEACFVRECNPADDSECPENIDERTSYYKLINKNAKNIPPCDATSGECPTELSCDPGEAECEMILCDETNVPEGETCNDPAVYAEKNPPCDCLKDADKTASEEESVDNSNDNADTIESDNNNQNDNGDAMESKDNSNNNASCSCDKKSDDGNDNTDTGEGE